MNIIRDASRRILALLTDEYSFGRPFLSAPVKTTLDGSTLRIASLDGSEDTAILFWSSKIGGVTNTQCTEVNGDVHAVRLPDDAWPGYGI